MEETHTDLTRIYKSFGIQTTEKNNPVTTQMEELNLEYTQTIQQINKSEWDTCFFGKGTFDWDGLDFLEKVFTNNNLKEHNWAFHYITIKDKIGKIILAAPLTSALLKNDMLSDAKTSKAIEEMREQDPYYMTDMVLSLGSVFSEGTHLFLDDDHPLHIQTMRLFLEKIDEIKSNVGAKLIILRDFEKTNTLNAFLHKQGFISIDMPDSCEIANLNWRNEEQYISTLSKRSRKHFKKDIKAFENYFNTRIVGSPTPAEIDKYYQLFEEVWSNNLGINTFKFPKKLFSEMVKSPKWDFLTLYLKADNHDASDKIVGVMFITRSGKTFIPAFVGMDYEYNEKFNIYRQLLYQAIKTAGILKFEKINFGFSASFEKKKLGATLIPKIAYVQADDNFILEALNWLRKD
jgi:predicted N-acyltransferase